MAKNKKILALSFGLIVVFSCENTYGMKRKLDTFVNEDDGDLENQNMRPVLQKQMGLESFYNNTEFSELSTVRKADQAILSHSNKDNNNNVDEAHERLFNQVMDLVVNQADLNEQDADGNTLLHRAVLAGYEDIVQLLVGNGADSTISNNGGDTPFTLALNEDRHSITRFLMDNQ